MTNSWISQNYQFTIIVKSVAKQSHKLTYFAFIQEFRTKMSELEVGRKARDDRIRGLENQKKALIEKCDLMQVGSVLSVPSPIAKKPSFSNLAIVIPE